MIGKITVICDKVYKGSAKWMKRRRLCKAEMSDKVKNALIKDNLVLKDETVQAIHEFAHYAQAFAKTAEDSIRYYSVTVQQQMKAIGDIGSEDDFRDNRNSFKYMKHLDSTIAMCENTKKFLEYTIKKIDDFTHEQDDKLNEIKTELNSTKQASHRVRRRILKAGFFDNFKKKVKEKAKDLFHYDRKSDQYKVWSTGDFGSEEIYAYGECVYKEVQRCYRIIYDMKSPQSTFFLHDLKEDKDKFQQDYDIDLSNDIDREAIVVAIESNEKLLQSYAHDMKPIILMLDKPMQQLQDIYDKVMNF